MGKSYAFCEVFWSIDEKGCLYIVMWIGFREKGKLLISKRCEL